MCFYTQANCSDAFRVAPKCLALETSVGTSAVSANRTAQREKCKICCIVTVQTTLHHPRLEAFFFFLTWMRQTSPILLTLLCSLFAFLRENTSFLIFSPHSKCSSSSHRMHLLITLTGHQVLNLATLPPEATTSGSLS